MHDDIYEVQYRTTLNELEQKSHLPDFDLNSVKNELEALYNYEGLGWAGRGLVKSSQIAADIAAYEAFLNGMKQYG